MKAFIKKNHKKFILPFIAVLIIIGTLVVEFNNKVIEVEAAQNIFAKVQEYNTNGIKILEIVPNTNSGEMGYFINRKDGDKVAVGTQGNGNSGQGYQKISDVTYGTYYGADDANNTDNHKAILSAMRSYGMIKYLGLDSITASGVSEYPIYTPRWATFTQGTTQGGYAPLNSDSRQLVDGKYSLATSATTNYQMNTGYVLGGTVTISSNSLNSNLESITSLEEHYFYKCEEKIISQNDVGDNVVSDNGISTDVYTKVNNGPGIPAAVSYVTDGNGNLEFSYVVNQADIYQGYSTTEYLYLSNREPDNGWFKAGSWFKEYILGDAANNSDIQFTMKTANDVTAADIKNYDLIYISGESDTYVQANVDLSDDVVMEIYNQTTQNFKAIMMDYLSYSGNETPKNNIDRVAMLTWQENQKYTPTNPSSSDTYGTYFDAAGIMTNNAAVTDATLYQSLFHGMQVGYNGNFAVNNVFVYNHHWEDYQLSLLRYEQVDALDNFANGDFKSPYVSAANVNGFQSVLSYIKINNNTSSIGHMAEGVVTPAIAIQYILAYRGEDLGAIKNQYSVLEIQPTKQYLYNQYNESEDYSLSIAEVKSNRDTFITNVLGSDTVTAGKQDYITFTSMTIDEFNTRQEDLLSNYDIIYIGDEYSKYYEVHEGNTFDIETQAAVTDKYPINGTTNMSGLIYFNQGSYFTNSVTGVMDRYSSRDLTEPKLKEFKNYLNNNGLIVCGADLMSSYSKGNRVINPTALSGNSVDYDNGRIDTSSNMYELFRYALGSTYDSESATYSSTTGSVVNGIYPNLVSERDLAKGYVSKLDIASYLGKAKLGITMLEVPVAYSYNTDDKGVLSSVSYLQPETDGKYYLKYQFSIDNSEIDGAVGQTYKVSFYQDINSDGRYGDNEEKTDIKISTVADGVEIDKLTSEDGVTAYNLNASVAYELVRQVPYDEGGIINWCIKVEKSTDSNIFANAQGYVAIKPTIKKNINLLQITANENNNLNLENLSDSSDFKKYLNTVVVSDQYNITLKTITLDQFEKDLSAYIASTDQDGFGTVDAWMLNYFATFQRTEDFFTSEQKLEDTQALNVNMITLGYGDSMPALSDSTTIALKAFLDSGKPVLYSNNCIQDVLSNNATALASFAGVDRYGYTSALYVDGKDKFFASGEEFYGKYAKSRELDDLAIAYVPNSVRKSLTYIRPGYTNTILKQNENSLAFIQSEAVKAYSSSNDTLASKNYTYIDKMNDGQICNFPYKINDHVLIGKSHAQSFQLDLDSDADKNNQSDAIVWFTLSAMTDNLSTAYSDAIKDDSAASANIYSATPGDGINNYYIYNYGNVTYTGIGANSTFTSSEVQLYVNTLLAAFEAGFTNPSVTYYKAADVDEGELDSFAVAYDANITFAVDKVDSSIQYDEKAKDYMYKFVNPNTDSTTDEDGTKAFFKINDSNFVKGEKVATTAFYLEVDGKSGDTYTLKDGNNTYTYNIEEILLEDNTAITVVRIPIDIYNDDFSEKIGRSSNGNIDNPELEIGKVYGIYAPMSYLATKGAANIYIQANTGYKAIDDVGKEVVKPLGTAFDMFSMMKQDLLKLD